MQGKHQAWGPTHGQHQALHDIGINNCMMLLSVPVTGASLAPNSSVPSAIAAAFARPTSTLGGYHPCSVDVAQHCNNPHADMAIVGAICH